MPGLIKRMSHKAGMSPGTLMHLGEKKIESVRIHLMDYGPDHMEERELEGIGECPTYKDEPSITWLNVIGLHQVDLIEAIGNSFGVHPLVLEDILNTSQRPKMEIFEDYAFITCKMLIYDHDKTRIHFEQVSLILGPSFVISFQEMEGDAFDSVRERIRKGRGRIRKMGPDYLLHALLDAIVDQYFVVLEKIGTGLEEMEEDLINDPTPDVLERIHSIKRELIFLRKSVWPLREVVSALQRDEASLISESTHVFLRDLYDHTIQAIETVETYNDMGSGLLDYYMSQASNRMNEVMKVLTIVATLFIPVTFIAGIYGMNFEFMPELQWKWAYPATLVLMLAMAVGMLIWFKRKRFL
ncbi:MAG: magnesium/cobalt transporter CorA [Desulfobacteraceae bacterium]